MCYGVLGFLNFNFRGLWLWCSGLVFVRGAELLGFFSFGFTLKNGKIHWISDAS